MCRIFLAILVIVGSWHQSSASVSDDERLRSDLQEAIKARLFVVPIRIETTSSAKRGECASLGPEELTVSIRGKVLKDKVYRQKIKDGLITLDRRPRPMLHAMVFDTSGSMSMDLPDAKTAALAYLDNNLGDLDKGMVVGFDDGVTLWQRATPDKKKLRAAIERVDVAGQTSLFDALVNTIRELDVYRERPVIVLISDGLDNASFYDADDVVAELKRRRDLVIFSISVGNRSSSVREMLRRIATTTFGQYFDVHTGDELASVFEEIQDVLGTEAVLSVVDPDPTAESNKITVRSFNSDCFVTVLGKATETSGKMTAREPIPMPPPSLPTSYRRPLSESYQKILARGTLLQNSKDCYDRARPPKSWLSQWEFDVDLWSVTGCAPDIVLSHGYLYQPGAEPFIARNEEIQVKFKPFAIEIPRFENLADDPVALLDALLAALPEAPTAEDEAIKDRDTVVKQLSSIQLLLQGTTFLEMRPSIVRAFMSQPGYGDWAMARLETWIESDIGRLESRYRKLFPDYSPEAVQLATDNSDDAKAIRARLEAPTEVDLQPFLAAWLGDIESFTLFEAWERREINQWLEHGKTDKTFNEFVHGWRRLRNLLSVPSNVRVVAPLVPLYEAECDCVGFYRIVLPRPGLMRERIRESNPFFQRPRLDVAAKLPFGYALIQALNEQIPGVVERLRAGSYRVLSVDYELLGPPEFHDPVRAFRETRVRLELAAASTAERAVESRTTLVAELHWSAPPPRPPDPSGTRNLPPRRPRWLVDRVEVEVRHDPELKKLFDKPNKALVGYELLKGSTRQPLRNGSGEPTAPGF